ncbi:MAG TPA: MATE family efflux transporter [Spirochaetia bacterium]|nr:MATE family efflux transporter [Spirochaetia bacterium]
MSLDRTQISLVRLAWPIFIENLLRTSLMSVDTFMLSRYSESAVAAMSIVNNMAFFIQLLYMMAAIGASILISQNLGAGNRRQAGLVGVGSLSLILVVSVVVSGAVALLARPVLDLYRLDPDVALYGRQFLVIYGGLSFFMAFNIGQASILRAWGHPSDPMIVNVTALILTVAGDALCLFGPFGFPVLGVVGVASSTVFSQVVSCLLYAIMIRRRREIDLPLSRMAKIPGSVYRSVLAVGVPTAGENISYNISQIVIMSIVARLGTDALATFGILIAILRYVFMPGISIGTGGQIKVGYFVGAGRAAQAERRVYGYFAIGFLASLTAIIVINIFKGRLLGIFTSRASILGLGATVLLVSIVHEPGRNFNTIINPALKGAGDIHFPVAVGIVGMWSIGTFGAWFLGLKLGMGLVGVWMAMAADEWSRGIVNLIRWRSGAWKEKALVQPSDAAVAAGF